MLKLFSTTEKPSNSHTRSKTQPQIDIASANINASPASIAIVNGQQFRFIEPPSAQPTEIQQRENFVSAPLTEPRKAHQRNLTEQVRSTTDLPPLVTKAADLSMNPISQNVQAPSNAPCQLHRFPDRSRQTSPAKTDRISLPFDAKEKQTKSTDKAVKLANWFKGESEPIAIGILPSPVKETPDPFDGPAPSSEIRPSSLLQRTSTAIASSKPAMASRLSFLTSKATSMKPSRHSTDIDDEFINMDISKALLPTRASDPLSPTAFKDLQQQQAESLLSRLQAAYKERTTSLRDMMAEKEALSEETEGAETRARHLKTQLDDMSIKLAEQDEAMMNLVDELAQEKLARREEEEARKRSVRLVEHKVPPTTCARSRGASLSNTISSDSGFESEDDSSSSSAESVFSRRNGAHSPAMSMSSVSTTNSPEVYPTIDFHSPATVPRTQSSRLRGIPTHTVKGTILSHQDDIIEEPAARSVCKNCNGAHMSEAWGVVNVLQEENKCIKRRVGELEDALDGCLVLVRGLS